MDRLITGGYAAPGCVAVYGSSAGGMIAGDDISPIA